MFKNLVFYISLMAVSNTVIAAMIPGFEGNSTGFFKGNDALFVADTLTWGTPLSISNPTQSSLNYAETAGGFSIDTDNPFKIGTINFKNTRIRDDANALSDAKMMIQISFSSPAIGIIDFLYDLKIMNTIDGLDSDDSVIFQPSGGFNPFIASIGNVNYYFDLLGFREGNNYSNQFALAEGAEDSFELFATISAVNPIPEPSIIWLVLTVMGVTVLIPRQGSNV